MLLVAGFLGAASTAAQQVAGSADARPRFDVASIRPCTANASAGRGGWAGTALPGRLRIDCQSFFQLMRTAYQVFAGGRVNPPGTYPTFEPDLGSPKAPDWTAVMRFTIEAVTERTPPPSPAVMRGPMLQRLLEERFKLKIRRETREMAVDELVVSKGGAKLKPLQPGTCVPYDSSVYPQPALEPGQRQCRNISSERDASGTAWIQTAEAMTLDDLAAGMRGRDRKPVINKTAITGFVSFRVIYTDDYNTAVKDQLGLELRPARAMREFLVIDHIEQLEPNE
jgi:uncharacterized protein (TIGR03435 family)